MEKIIKTEFLEDDEVEFVKEWNNTTETSWSKESRRLTESQKISIIEIKRKLIKNEVTRIEPAPSTSTTDPLGQVMFKCCLCFELFNCEAELKAHAAGFHAEVKKKRIYKKPLPFKPTVYQCDTCSKKFQRRRNFIQHYRRLHDPSWFKCNKCSRTFRKEAQLCIHAGQQNDCAKEHCSKNNTIFFICKYCEKTFARKYYMTRHVRNIHESVPVTCQLCAKTFSCKANLQRHNLRVHRSK